MTTWEHFIPGVPKPQGSKTSGTNRQTGKTFVREDNKGTKPWRKRMVEDLQDERGRPLHRFDSAVWVSLRFVFLRPKSHAPDSLPTSKLLGDVDKLTRNVLDALTQAGVITDDKYVIKLRDVEKVYGPNPGVHIRIGSAHPNPFADLSGAPGRPITIPRSAVESWQPGAQAVAYEALRNAQHAAFLHNLENGDKPTGGPCSCAAQCRGYSVCKLLRVPEQRQPPYGCE